MRKFNDDVDFIFFGAPGGCTSWRCWYHHNDYLNQWCSAASVASPLPAYARAIRLTWLKVGEEKDWKQGGNEGRDLHFSIPLRSELELKANFLSGFQLQLKPRGEGSTARRRTTARRSTRHSPRRWSIMGRDGKVPRGVPKSYAENGKIFESKQSPIWCNMRIRNPYFNFTHYLLYLLQSKAGWQSQNKILSVDCRLLSRLSCLLSIFFTKSLIFYKKSFTYRLEIVFSIRVARYPLQNKRLDPLGWRPLI